MSNTIKATAVAVHGREPRTVESLTPGEVCGKLTAWAEVAGVSSARGNGALAVVKSDLLSRMIYAGENPSQTPCPVHKGVWSGCHFAWPGAKWVKTVDGKRHEMPVEVEPMLQEWWDAGCRCATHQGSSCTTGWNPDEHCGCIITETADEV